MLTSEQQARYLRHLMLDEVGNAGQERLLASRVLIIGAGGLGSPAALYLAAAGVGTIGIVDSDVVELSNLQRQILHATPDLGLLKVESARTTLAPLNPDVRLVTHPFRVTAENIDALLVGYDFVIDATDNFAAKFLINDACVLAGIPYCHGGVLRFDGQVMTVLPGASACYRCIFPEPPAAEVAEACSRAGIMGVVPGVIGTLQATEALKYLLAIGRSASDGLLTFNALTCTFRTIPLRRSFSCPLCGERPSISRPADLPQT
ncbi:MAG TPA: ThiF family adenylyltransferase [Geobacteraceae bacterium]